ncbi:hypothetical protein DFH06DRAFT_56150 [Mycena polygramma]|nr:hypothetical protein DFH06DRAFT_56150 [Mycena polygramma]
MRGARSPRRTSAVASSLVTAHWHPGPNSANARAGGGAMLSPGTLRLHAFAPASSSPYLELRTPHFRALPARQTLDPHGVTTARSLSPSALSARCQDLLGSSARQTRDGGICTPPPPPASSAPPALAANPPSECRCQECARRPLVRHPLRTRRTVHPTSPPHDTSCPLVAAAPHRTPRTQTRRTSSHCPHADAPNLLALPVRQPRPRAPPTPQRRRGSRCVPRASPHFGLPSPHSRLRHCLSSHSAYGRHAWKIQRKEQGGRMGRRGGGEMEDGAVTGTKGGEGG